MPECVEKLEIWQDAMKRAKVVYTLTGSWPKEELYGSTPWNMRDRRYSMGQASQMRRAAVSVPANPCPVE